MKKLLIPVVVLGSLLPILAYAAYNDVVLGAASANISVNSITLGVSSSDANVETIAVGATSFTATLQTGSSLKVSPAGTTQMSYDVTYTGSNAPQVSYVCTSATSTLLVTASSQVTLVVTPLSTACTGPGESTSGGGSSSPGSSGGGGSTTVSAPATATVVAAPVISSATIASLQAQLNALLAQLAVLQGTPAPAPAAAKGLITAFLASGSRGPNVKVLQQFFNTHGFVIASSGPGSPGKETETFGSLTVKAVQKFQVEYGIAKPGEPGYGRIGPKTRAKINELSAN